LSKDALVLNCFAYTGAFSVYCAEGGAKKVISVDVSKAACATARKNLHLNWFPTDSHPVIEEDAFIYLRNTQENFNVIILDPPAFAKTGRMSARRAGDIRMLTCKPSNVFR